jgi:hypothetical protein
MKHATKLRRQRSFKELQILAARSLRLHEQPLVRLGSR